MINASLDILSFGAVTSVGLNAMQTAASFRARIAGFAREYPLAPPEESLTIAKIPVHASLRATEKDWLINLADRVIREALQHQTPRARIGLVFSLPEKGRRHPAMHGTSSEELVAMIARKVGISFAFVWAAEDDNGGIAMCLAVAREQLLRGTADVCVVGAADSMINRADVERLRNADRIVQAGNPKGLIPGEGAAVLLVALSNYSIRPVATLYGISSSIEEDSVLGLRRSRGRGFERAIGGVFKDSGLQESVVSFRVSTVNGEDYAVWESMFYAMRAYRTRRPSFPVWYTASVFGDMGESSGALAIVLAATGIAGGYAPGPYAICESSSETGMRSACLVGPAPGFAHPPFRIEQGASSHVLGLRAERG